MAIGNTWTNVASRSVYVAPATITFYIDVKLNRQDISGNYSVVDTRLTSTISGSAAGSGYRFTLTGSNGISGDAVWYFGNETILTGQTTIYHNDDGTKVGSASAYCYNRYLGISLDFSGNFELPTIARASVPTISPSSTFNIGDTITINTNRKSNSFTHTLSLSFGSYTYQIGTNVGASTTLNTSTIANNLYQQIPNANSGNGTITCITYNGSTQVGTKSVSFTAKVVNSNPTFNQAYLDTNSTTTAVTQNNQQIIRNKSTLRVNITNASAKNYSTLSSAKVVINGVTYNGTFSGSSSTINVGTLNLSSNTTAKVSVTDSRGNTTTKDLAITILDWVMPSAIIKLERENNFYSTTNINVNAEYSSLDNKNTISIKVREKKTTESTWSAYTTLQDEVTAQLDLDNQYAWNIQVVLEDRISTYTYDLTLNRGIPIVFYDKNKRSIGLDRFPQNESSFELDGDIITGSIRSKNMLNPKELANGTVSATDGKYAYYSYVVVSNYIPVKANKPYTLKLNNITDQQFFFRIVLYDTSKSRNSNILNSVEKTEYTFTPNIDGYVRICFAKRTYVDLTSNEISITNPQFEENNVPTIFTPFQNLNGEENYSRDEIVIGTWIDDKPLYRKVYDISHITSSNTNLVNISGLNIDNIVRLTGFVKTSAGEVYPMPMYDSTNNYYILFFNNTYIRGRCSIGSGYNLSLAKAIIEYTKTTD